MLFVDNLDEHCARARAAAATVVEEPFVLSYVLTTGSIAAMQRSIPKATSGGSQNAYGIRPASNCAENGTQRYPFRTR